MQEVISCLIPSAAAHQIASIGAGRCPVAVSALCAIGAGFVVQFTVVGRVVDVEQILGSGPGVPGVADLQLRPLVQSHLGGAVVLVFEEVADLEKE